MHRICTSLALHGYDVTLVGRRLKTSLPLADRPFRQRRIYCWFTKGKLFYAEYNARLLFYLLFRRIDAICAIDLDTILPCLRIAKWKKIPRIYDAHELFTGLKEVATRAAVLKIWTAVERKAVPQFPNGYTVSASVAEEFERRYGVQYEVIRNVPVLQELAAPDNNRQASRTILYAGAVNEARAFEYLIPALQWIDARLIVCGDGNFMPQLKELIARHGMQHKVELKGMLLPADLWQVAQQASIGVAVAENEGLNQYFALPNKFLDYIHAGLPQVTMNYPEYQRINNRWEVAVLIGSLEPQLIAAAINNLLNDVVLYDRLRKNCLKARLELNWQEEQKKLIRFYQSVIPV